MIYLLSSSSSTHRPLRHSPERSTGDADIVPSPIYNYDTAPSQRTPLQTSPTWLGLVHPHSSAGSVCREPGCHLSLCASGFIVVPRPLIYSVTHSAPPCLELGICAFEPVHFERWGRVNECEGGFRGSGCTPGHSLKGNYPGPWMI